MPQNSTSGESRSRSASGERADRSNEPGTIRGQAVDTLPPGYARNDEGIRQDVMTRIDEQVELEAEEIEVLVDGGAVTLCGTVKDEAARTAAERAACSVQGVNSVDNQLLSTTD